MRDCANSNPYSSNQPKSIRLKSVNIVVFEWYILWEGIIQSTSISRIIGNSEWSCNPIISSYMEDKAIQLSKEFNKPINHPETPQEH